MWQPEYQKRTSMRTNWRAVSPGQTSVAIQRSLTIFVVRSVLLGVEMTFRRITLAALLFLLLGSIHVPNRVSSNDETSATAFREIHPSAYIQRDSSDGSVVFATGFRSFGRSGTPETTARNFLDLNKVLQNYLHPSACSSENSPGVCTYPIPFFDTTVPSEIISPAPALCR